MWTSISSSIKYGPFPVLVFYKCVLPNGLLSIAFCSASVQPIFFKCQDPRLLLTLLEIQNNKKKRKENPGP